MANKKITSLKRTIKKYLSELILNEKKLGGKCKKKYKIGPPRYGAWSIGKDGKYYCSTGGYSNPHTHIDPNDKVYKLKSANMMRERDELPTDTDGCQCCRDKVVATGSFGGCCRWCKGGKAAAPTMDMSEKRKMTKNATKSCPCCKTGYELCCLDCYNDGLIPESTMLNESYYCNGAGQNASSHPGCREHGAACINWGEGVAGTMGQNVNDPDDWQCVPNELNVGTGGTGGGPLSGDDLVVKTKGGNKNPFYKPKSSIDQMMREAAKDIVRERKIKK